jgi:ABC-type enterochelin transport system permease subunit
MGPFSDASHNAFFSITPQHLIGILLAGVVIAVVLTQMSSWLKNLSHSLLTPNN